MFDDEHARAHDVVERGTGLFERALDPRNRALGLHVGIGAVAGRSRNEDEVADAHRARVTDPRLPHAPALDVAALRRHHKALTAAVSASTDAFASPKSIEVLGIS